MTASITGIGVWLPDEVRRNDAWPQQFVYEGHKRGERTLNDVQLSEDARSADLMRPYQLQELDPFLGATERRVAPPGMTAYEAGLLAARAALTDAGLPGSRVTHILEYGIVPDAISPPTATAIAYAIGAKESHAFSVDTACASAITMMELGSALLLADPSRVILCVQTHLLLRTMPLLHPATPGLGDASTAFVMTSETDRGLEVLSAFGVTHGEFHDSVIWRRGHKTDDNVPWYMPGDDGFRVGTLNVAGVKYLQRETVPFGAKTVEEAARRANVAVGYIDTFVSVQPREYLPGCIAERLGLPRSAAVETYAQIAHVGGCGPVYNLWTARELGLLKPDGVVAVYGQGAGFTRAAAILDVR